MKESKEMKALKDCAALLPGYELTTKTQLDCAQMPEHRKSLRDRLKKIQKAFHAANDLVNPPSKAVTLNEKERLYVIPENGGYSCLGFDVCEHRTVALARELAALGVSIPAPAITGTLERYEQYRALCEIARQKNAESGWRSKSELTPELIGLENKRVEVVHQWKSGREEKIRFWVGKSTGYIPCHLQIEGRGDDGGGAVCLGTIKSVRVIDNER